jgi:hypothetical protein
MITASVSNSTEVAEELLSYFVDIGNKECFAAMLYICFDLFRSDVVEELSWRHGLNDFYMPYKIQMQRSLVEKVRPIAYLSNTPDLIPVNSWHSLRRRSRSNPRRKPKRSRKKLRLQSSIQVASVGDFC